MICVPCRKRQHKECPGGSWCDCQHLPPTGPDGAEGADGPGGPGAAKAEPALTWLRQG